MGRYGAAAVVGLKRKRVASKTTRGRKPSWNVPPRILRSGVRCPLAPAPVPARSGIEPAGADQTEGAEQRHRTHASQPLSYLAIQQWYLALASHICYHHISPMISSSPRWWAYFDDRQILGGVPRSILYDNTRLAVARILGDGRRQRTRVFSELVMLL